MAYEETTYEKKPLGCLTNSMRMFLMLINFIFIVASIGGIVISVLLITKKETNYLRFCHSCSGFSTYAVITFSALLFFSFVGFVALWRRTSCLLVLYGIFLVLFFLLATALTILVVLVHEGKFDKELNDAWNEDAQHASNSLCNFEVKVKCNGWEIKCPETYNSTYAKVCPDCSFLSAADQAALQTYPTCKTLLKNDVNKYFWILIGVGAGLMALTFLSFVTSCKVRGEVAKYSELNERF